MAKDNVAQLPTGGDPNAGEAPKRKRRAPEGPRKVRPLHVALHVTDVDGNVIEGAQVVVDVASRDLETVYDKVMSDKSLTHLRIPLDKA